MNKQENRFHELKTWPELFNAVMEPNKLKRKTVDIRKDDRDYKVEDTLILKEFNPVVQEYTGRSCWRIVTHCLREQPWVPEGYVAMSICEISPDTMFC